MLKEAHWAAILLALLLGALPAAATTIATPLTKDGNDVGWTAYYPDGHSISITVEDFDDSNVTLSIDKTLLPPAIGEEATVAINFLRNGGDVFSLQMMLGHSTLDIVKLYVNLAGTDVQAAHRKYSPADNLALA